MYSWGRRGRSPSRKNCGNIKPVVKRHETQFPVTWSRVPVSSVKIPSWNSMLSLRNLATKSFKSLQSSLQAHPKCWHLPYKNLGYATASTMAILGNYSSSFNTQRILWLTCADCKFFSFIISSCSRANSNCSEQNIELAAAREKHLQLFKTPQFFQLLEEADFADQKGVEQITSWKASVWGLTAVQFFLPILGCRVERSQIREDHGAENFTIPVGITPPCRLR